MDNSHLRNLKPCVKTFYFVQSRLQIFKKSSEAYIVGTDFYSLSCIDKLEHFWEGSLQAYCLEHFSSVSL